LGVSELRGVVVTLARDLTHPHDGLVTLALGIGPLVVGNAQTLFEFSGALFGARSIFHGDITVAQKRGDFHELLSKFDFLLPQLRKLRLGILEPPHDRVPLSFGCLFLDPGITCDRLQIVDHVANFLRRVM
jgi:hypothetical protein